MDILLTTYNMILSGLEDRKWFRRNKWQYVIFDEAHKLKNMSNQTYTRMDKINGKNRLLLTATPLQNYLLELMALLFFIMPSKFAKFMEDVNF